MSSAGRSHQLGQNPLNSLWMNCLVNVSATPNPRNYAERQNLAFKKNLVFFGERGFPTEKPSPTIENRSPCIKDFQKQCGTACQCQRGCYTKCETTSISGVQGKGKPPAPIWQTRCWGHFKEHHQYTVTGKLQSSYTVRCCHWLGTDSVTPARFTFHWKV